MAEALDRTPTGRRSAARERLLTAASRVFYAEGINSVSVDYVISEAKVTRSTFYRYFPGKDDLVAAYVTDRHESIQALWADTETRADDPGEKLRLLMGVVGDELCTAGFRGCPFINAAVEFPDPDSAVHRAVQTHRSWFRSVVIDLLTRAGARQPERDARTMMVLRDGAMVGAYLEDAAATRATLVELVDAVVPAPDGTPSA